MKESESSNKRILAIDPGTKRTGFAVTDPLGITAQGLETYELNAEKPLIEHIQGLIDQYSVSIIVLGMPLSMSGGELEGTARSQDLAARIEEKTDICVILRDERMTSLEAERVMKQEGRIKKAGDIDRLSAVILLQSYLEEKNG